MISQSYRLWFAEEVAGGDVQVGYVIGWHLPTPLADVDSDADNVAVPVVAFVDEKTSLHYWTGLPSGANQFFADTKEEAIKAVKGFAAARDEHNRRELAKTQKTEAHA